MEYRYGKENIDWANIGFGYIRTDYRFVSQYKTVHGTKAH